MLLGVVAGLPFVAEVLQPLAWVAFVPFLVFLATERIGRGLLFTYLFTFAFTATGCFWLYPLSWFILLMCAATYAPNGLLHALVPVVLRRAPALPLWTYVPLLGTFLEKTVESLSISETTWLFLGNTQANVLPLIQIAEWTGAAGVSLLVYLVNAALADLVLALGRRRGWFERKDAPTKRLLLLGAALALALPLSSAALGRVRLAQVSASIQQGPRVLLVQGNIPPAMKGDPDFASATLARQVRLTTAALHPGIELVAWAETMPLLPETPQGASTLRRIASAVNRPLLLGALGDASEGGVTRYANSAYLVSKTGEIQGRYDKHSLVPFGETLPIVGRFPWLRVRIEKAINEAFGFYAVLRAGTEYTLFPLAHRGRDLRFAAPICFEDVLPRMTTRFTQKGADFIILISNENFYHPREMEQHVNMAVLRAIETRRPVLRATNTGLTCVVDPVGRVTRRLERDIEATLETSVPLSGVTSSFLIGPLIFGWLCGLAALGIIGAVVWRGRRRPTAPP